MHKIISSLPTFLEPSTLKLPWLLFQFFVVASICINVQALSVSCTIKDLWVRLLYIPTHSHSHSRRHALGSSNYQVVYVGGYKTRVQYVTGAAPTSGRLRGQAERRTASTANNGVKQRAHVIKEKHTRLHAHTLVEMWNSSLLSPPHAENVQYGSPCQRPHLMRLQGTASWGVRRETQHTSMHTKQTLIVCIHSPSYA